MGGIVKSVFGGGGGGGRGRNVDLNRLFSTGTSTMRGGKLTLDPRIDALRGQYLSGIQGLQGQAGALSGFGTRFGQLGEEFAGNQGALIQARMNPLQQNIARQRGQLTQNIGRRGLAGSSFGNQALTSFETESGRALGDAQALATADALQARSGLLGQEMTAEQANIQNQVLLNELLGGASGQFLQQELAGLGLGAESIASLLGSQAQQDQLGIQSRGQDMNLLGAGLGAAGSFLLGVSDRRLKKNIKHLTKINGINFYSFDYLWNESAIGVMADEVEHINGAVYTLPSGYKVVDYARVL